MITHREANDVRLSINHSDLKNNTKGTYRYKIVSGLLVLQK